MPGLVDVGRQGYLRSGSRALGGLADAERRRENLEDQMDATERAQKNQLMGTGAGMGMMALSLLLML